MRKPTPASPSKSEVQQALGERFRLLRKQADLTQEELAHRLGVSKNAVSELERGLTFPTLDTLLKLAGVLDVQLSDLFDVQGRIPRNPRLQGLVALLADQPPWVLAVLAEQAQSLVKALESHMPHE